MAQNTGFVFDADNLVLRGNFALEDGNFEKAEQFFEQALNFDARCAEAYLGSFLVEKRCSSLENYIARRLQETAPAISEPQPIQKNVQHIEEMATNYAVEPHFTGDAIRKMYQQEFSYDSCVPMRRTQRKAEEETWNNHPSLIRAERFASGSFAQKLAQSKQGFFEKLDQRITEAKTEEISAQQEQLTAYEDFLKQTDEQVRQIQEAALRGDYIPTPEHKEEKVKYKSKIAITAAALVAVIALVIGLVAFLPKKGAEEMMQKNIISAGYHHTVGLKADGTAEAIGWNDEGQCNVSEWTDIVAISAGESHTVGLKADGTVVAASITEDYIDDGQCNVSEWTDIVAISAGRIHTVGLKADGTVVATGDNYFDQCDDVSEWTDIVAISAGESHTVGLKSDGTVVAVGDNRYGQCDLSGWTDIVAISAGSNHTVGLKADGTVVAVGQIEYGRCNVSEWTDIVAISAGRIHTVGLKANGTVVAIGRNKNGKCDVSDWTDIVAISAGGNHTVGLKADGTVVATGYDGYGQCDVSDWVLAVPEE